MASKGNPAIAQIVVLLLYLLCNQLMITVETLVWGERFTHWFDVVFGVFVIGYVVLVTAACKWLNEDTYREKKEEPPEQKS